MARASRRAKRVRLGRRGERPPRLHSSEVGSGGGITIITMMPYDPAPDGAWTSYAIALAASGGWRRVDGIDVDARSDVMSAPEASDADLQTVLSMLPLLRIRGEYNFGPDSGSLDNVRFGV